jgi:phenylacetate-CoA ligase
MLDSPEIPTRDPDHEARALASIERALREVPFYVKRGHAAPSGSLAETLAALPVLFKKDVRAALPKQWAATDVKAKLASGELDLVETSGTIDRVRVLEARGAWDRQERRALRVNAEVARHLDDASYRDAVLTMPSTGMRTCHTGDLAYDQRVAGSRLLLNQRPDPMFWSPEDRERMLDEIAHHRATGLVADPTYLALLAGYADAAARTIDTRFVVTTYAHATAAHARMIRRVFTGELVELYAARETGALFVGDADRLHHVPRTTHVELLRAKVATPGARDVALVVVTTIDRDVMPLVRYCLGDLVGVDRDGARRFTTVPPLASLEGRVEDALVRPDGALVTAGAIDRALAPIASLRLFQANQREPGAVEIDLVADGDVADDVRARLAPLFEGMTVTPRVATGLAIEASGRFRVARRHFPLDLASAFEGL